MIDCLLGYLLLLILVFITVLALVGVFAHLGVHL